MASFFLGFAILVYSLSLWKTERFLNSLEQCLSSWPCKTANPHAHRCPSSRREPRNVLEVVGVVVDLLLLAINVIIRSIVGKEIIRAKIELGDDLPMLNHTINFGEQNGSIGRNCWEQTCLELGKM
jgi:hypothetical protein